MAKTGAECVGFHAEALSEGWLDRLKRSSTKARGDILKMTTLAGCGHPGGSMSSMDLFMALYSLGNVSPGYPDRPDRDRVVVSHGHTSPGVYAALGGLGFFDIDEAVAHFRQSGTPFEGHVEHGVAGVEWSSGNLGQGLSAGCGMALASRFSGIPYRVYVVMGDGEQQKGQISEARRFAVKHRLFNLTCLVDRNRLQISGETRRVMPQNIRENFLSDGWRVVEVDGHDFPAIYGAVRDAGLDTGHCTCVVADTVMGKGVPFMEDDERWHGSALSRAQCAEALAALGLEDDLDRYEALRLEPCRTPFHRRPAFRPDIDAGPPKIYGPGASTDNRSAWGACIEDVAKRNPSAQLAVFDCDLAVSVKTSAFAKAAPDKFVQGGIMEQNAATAAGAMSVQGVQVFWSEFGVFGVGEVYNQQRMNDINETNLKLVCTHVGVDVGEDGKTHQCVDYLGLLRNLFNFKAVVPADPNQTDRVIRWAAGQPGNVFIGMGRSKNPVLVKPDGSPFFDASYEFRYGAVDKLRDGGDVALLTMGVLASRAVRVSEELLLKNIRAAVYNVPCPLAPLPDEVWAEIRHLPLAVTYEDHHVQTGLGASVSLRIAEEGAPLRLIRLGVKEYAQSGVPEDVLASQGMDEASVCKLVERILNTYAIQTTSLLRPVCIST